MTRTLDQLIMAARTDVESLEGRQRRWEVECKPRLVRGRVKVYDRDPWWLDFGLREIAVAVRRLEDYLARTEESR